MFFQFLTIVRGLFFLSVGIYEAVVAYNNSPNKIIYNNIIIQAYVFCVIKCILNIIGGLCMSLFCFLSIKDEQNASNKNISKKNSLKNKCFGRISFIVLTVLEIWSIIMYFGKYNLGPFQEILFVEVIIGFAPIFYMVPFLPCIICATCSKLYNGINENIINHDYEPIPQIVDV